VSIDLHMSLLHLLLKPANRNLLDVITKLPSLGVGSRVTRKSWEPYGDSYYEVTAVKPRNEDGSVGKVKLLLLLLLVASCWLLLLLLLLPLDRQLMPCCTAGCNKLACHTVAVVIGGRLRCSICLLPAAVASFCCC